MERELGLPLTPPTDSAQPLLNLTETNTDGSEDYGSIDLRTFRQIPDSSADIKENNDQSLIQAKILPLSSSTHSELIAQAAEDDQAVAADYQLQSLAGDNTLYDFLTSLGITREHIDDAQIPKAALLKLYQKELSHISWLKWSSLDHAMEKHLQWPLLSPSDLGSRTSLACDYRVRPQERSILLKSTWGLMKAYAVRGFVQGIETGLLKSVHYFIYAMIAYRLEELLKTGSTHFDEVQAIFEGSSQKGIDSLVQPLAKLDAQWLRLILVSPLILGIIQGIWKMRGAHLPGAEEIDKIAYKISTHLEKSGSFWRDVVCEEIPLLSNFLSLTNPVQKLEQWVRWDGRLDRETRRQAFELIRRVAREGKKFTQLNALESISKIAHGIGFKDLSRLQRAGYSPEELTDLLYIKATALGDLEDLSRELVKGKRSNPGKMTYLFAPLPRRFYASYLLWWLGQSTSWWRQRLPFSLLKIVKLGLEALFLQKIVASIIEAIRCPDKPGFQFGSGYQDWASDYTAECFTARINLFRTLDVNESVDTLVAEISEYHLTELIILDLSSKYLTTEEATQIIQAVVQKGATLKTLALSMNQLSILNNNIFSKLNQLNTLYLDLNYINVINSGVFNDLSQLNTLYLDFNVISTLNSGVFDGLNQLTYLSCKVNFINTLDSGIFSGLKKLAYLDLSENEISTLDSDILSELSQLNTLDLSTNRISILGEGVFSELTQLKTLDLFSNRLIKIRDDMFNKLNQLEILNLGFNQLYALNKNVFKELSQLQSLGLRSTDLNTSVIMDILPSMPITLTHLDISSNRMSYLPQNFSDLLPVSLLSLSIGGNDFIPKILTREFMQNFPFRLNSFSIQDSDIINITENTFLDFSSLKSLSLYFNRLSVLGKGVFNGLCQLNTLDLSVNQLSILDEDILGGLNQLKILDLTANELAVLPEGIFNKLSQLNALYLWINQLSSLNKSMFSGLNQLKILDLGGNELAALPEDIFNELSQLEILYLYDNQLTILGESMFSKLDQLNSLSLSFNELSVLSKNIFSGLNQLKILDLTANELAVLPEGMFNELSRLNFLELAGNQLNDTVIKNLTSHFPSQLNYLGLRSNLIGDEGALALAKIFPCTNLTAIDFRHNPANDTSLALAAQQNALKKVCDDQRCHANLPASESCGVTTDSMAATKITWGSGSSIEIIKDEMKLDSTDDFYWPHPAEISAFQFPLNLPNTDIVEPASSFTSGEMGTAILGMVGLGILLYKNSTLIHAIVNAGNHLFQRYWSDESRKEVRTTSLTQSPDRRYNLFTTSSSSIPRASTLSEAGSCALR